MFQLKKSKVNSINDAIRQREKNSAKDLWKLHPDSMAFEKSQRDQSNCWVIEPN